MARRPAIEDTPPATGGDYASLPAVEKRDRLFEAVEATAYPDGDLPGLVLGMLAFSRTALLSFVRGALSSTITGTGDEFATPKRKVFHTFGSTAKVRFDPEPGTPYTGMLSEPSHGLARFSYAGPTLAVGKVPGLGLKFPVTGGESADAVVMPGLDFQRGKSVFAHPHTNILPSPKWWNLIMGIVRFRFERVVARGRGLHQPFDRMASAHQDGRRVGEVRAPHRVILRPTPEAVAGSDPGLDFRLDLGRHVPSGTRIFDVLALEEGEEQALRARGLDDVAAWHPHARPIGSLASESSFVASAYGDFRLFIRHHDRFLRQRFR